ncbi:hypothetical protein chiPu_0004781 [Chiloscyllium punctatum]|uniref:Uncharacterized protein n=1 Tax=Chiloscyllium punctatum TaxID=137246 RepID=A0A401S7I9_CHIPU|nr:hypothetical protein [Chiloscyllium punctatum]
MTLSLLPLQKKVRASWGDTAERTKIQEDGVHGVFKEIGLKIQLDDCRSKQLMPILELKYKSESLNCRTLLM